MPFIKTNKKDIGVVFGRGDIGVETVLGKNYGIINFSQLKENHKIGEDIRGKDDITVEEFPVISLYFDSISSLRVLEKSVKTLLKELEGGK